MTMSFMYSEHLQLALYALVKGATVEFRHIGQQHPACPDPSSNALLCTPVIEPPVYFKNIRKPHRWSQSMHFYRSQIRCIVDQSLLPTVSMPSHPFIQLALSFIYADWSKPALLLPLPSPTSLPSLSPHQAGVTVLRQSEDTYPQCVRFYKQLLTRHSQTQVSSVSVNVYTCTAYTASHSTYVRAHDKCMDMF